MLVVHGPEEAPRAPLVRLDKEGHVNAYIIPYIKEGVRGDTLLGFRSIPITHLGTKPRVSITFFTAQMLLPLSNQTAPIMASKVAVMTLVGTMEPCDLLRDTYLSRPCCLATLSRLVLIGMVDRILLPVSKPR